MASEHLLRHQEANLLRALNQELDAHFFMDFHPGRNDFDGLILFTDFAPDSEPRQDFMDYEFQDMISPTVSYMGKMDAETIFDALDHTRALLGGVAINPWLDTTV